MEMLNRQALVSMATSTANLSTPPGIEAVAHALLALSRVVLESMC